MRNPRPGNPKQTLPKPPRKTLHRDPTEPKFRIFRRLFAPPSLPIRPSKLPHLPRLRMAPSTSPLPFQIRLSAKQNQFLQHQSKNHQRRSATIKINNRILLKNHPRKAKNHAIFGILS